MKTRLLYTTGNGYFSETEWDKPEITDDEIEVKAIMTGVCRSDIDMMIGEFGPLPLSMQGHEGVGEVTKVGKNIKDVTVGNFVATRGEPAYADFYNVKMKEYIRIPSAEPKYILEPVACGVNVVYQCYDLIKSKDGSGKRLLILGSGFLAWVAYTCLKFLNFEFDITVVGSNNQEIWGDILTPNHHGTFDVIIDLSSKTDVFDQDILNNESLIIFGSQKVITTDFSNILWKACTMVFPSPRTDKFYHAMDLARDMISSGILNVDEFWSNGYYRETEWVDAFNDGIARPYGYSRGYIFW